MKKTLALLLVAIFCLSAFSALAADPIKMDKLTFEFVPSKEADVIISNRMAEELADVLLYLVRLADVLEVDLAEAAVRKMAINAERYPAAKARGRADKYDRL